MINLLPKAEYANLHAARHNVLLIRLITAIIFIFVSTIIVAVATYLLIQNQERVANDAQSENIAKMSQYTNVEKESQAFISNLRIAKDILTKGTSYTTVLTNIATLLPEGTTVDTLTLSPDMINKPTQLVIHAKSYQDGVQIKDIINNSKVAKDAIVNDITYETKPAEQPNAAPVPASNKPYKVTLTTTFTPELLKKQTEEKS